MIINTDHYHLVFKLPSFCYPFITAFYKDFVNLLFDASKKTISKILKLSFNKDVIPGFIMVLHTHGKLNQFHPHIHVLITDGGFDKLNHKWILSQNSLFDFYQFNSIFQIILKKELLAFYKNHPSLGISFLDCINSNYKSFAFTSEKINDPYSIIDYFTKTIKGSNINEQNLKFEDDIVSINTGNFSSSLSQKNFIKRFLLHVLPVGLKTIRYFGLYSTKAKNSLAKVKNLFPDELNIYKENTLHPEYFDQQFDFLPYKFCPFCKKHMILIEKTLPFETPFFVLNTFGDDPPNLDFFNSIAA
ncbi:transposase [Leptospira levettii]|nr:transposase [Leptospira levettii]